MPQRNCSVISITVQIHSRLFGTNAKPVSSLTWTHATFLLFSNELSIRISLTIPTMCPYVLLMPNIPESQTIFDGKKIREMIDWFTSVLKSQSGDGVRLSRFCDCASLIDGEQVCGSSGMTANRPRCKHGDGGPYVSAKKKQKCHHQIECHFTTQFEHYSCSIQLKIWLLCELMRNRPCVCSGGPGEFGGHTRNRPIRVAAWSVPLLSSNISAGRNGRDKYWEKLRIPCHTTHITTWIELSSLTFHNRINVCVCVPLMGYGASSLWPPLMWVEPNTGYRMFNE